VAVVNWPRMLNILLKGSFNYLGNGRIDLDKDMTFSLTMRMMWFLPMYMVKLNCLKIRL
jgi:hypothetical protein